MTMPQPHLPETPNDALGDLVRDTVIIDDHKFRIERPKESDRILDHPAIRGAFAADEYMPYWADLWPASRMLARAILNAEWRAGTVALEVGCGLGLPGIAALAKGIHVVFSDCDLTAVRFAAANARLNGFHDFELLPMDWRFPPADRQFPLILCSDLCYECRHVDPLTELIAKLLTPDGLCLLTDQDRPPAPYLREMLVANGLTYAAESMRAGEPGGHRYKGTLYRIQKKVRRI
jgi:predicted nicotinamide N-methyase